MKNNQKKLSLSILCKKTLVLSMSTGLTGIFTAGVVQASDIEVYQTAKTGDITLMFLLDISGSMSRYNGNTAKYACDMPSKVGEKKRDQATEAQFSGGPKYIRSWCLGNDNIKYYDRITRVKDGMMDLLYGNPSAGIQKLTDDKVIGLSTLGAYKDGNKNTGAVLVPARRLDAQVDGKTQREVLIEKIGAINNWTNTPTARSYAETIAYLMGTSTSGKSGSGWSYSDISTQSGNVYSSPASLTQTTEAKKCSGQGIYVLTDGVPNKNNPTSDLAQAALGKSFTCKDSDEGWDCIKQMNTALLDTAKNIKGLSFKTAVVGFGSDFNNIISYDKDKNQEQNLNALGTIDSDEKRAAEWGILGEGGWYSGNSSQDVVNSVNDFISNLGSDIPSVTTGTPTIPNDELNPSILQKFAYYPQFQPTPGNKYQLWLGNLKKYNVNGAGKLTDRDNKLIVDTKGELYKDSVDLWAPNLNPDVAEGDMNTFGSKLNRFMGGVKSQLKLRADANATVNRKLLTNRIASGNNFVSSNNSLTAVTLDYLDKTDSAKGYLMALLGYDVDPTTVAGSNNITKDKLKAAIPPAELRQVGAVMHSSPVLLTSQGKVTYNESTGVIGSEQRNDYVLFGTTQGLLHVVDAETGQEKFAFVPNEMIESQKEAFLKPEAAAAGLNKMFYGVDGQWTVYSEYVLDSSGKLTVGNGLSSEKGKQRVYGGLRMGGRGYYGLNLDNINDPKLMFNINPDGAASGTPLSYMGQSWSKPALGWVKWGKSKRLVMFVGGGYDAGGDDGNAKTASVKGEYAGYENDAYNQKNARGAGVYMFDATDGTLLWWSSKNAISSSATATSGVIGLKDDNMQYSVVSEIKTVDRNADGLVDHLYFGDLGGQVFRIDLNNNASAQGSFAKSHRILNLSRTDGLAPRFYEMPAFSVYDDQGKTFAVMSIGSGNRSQPLQDYTVGTSGREYDGVYNVYDKDVTNPDLFTMDASKFLTANVDLNTSTGLKEITDSNRFGVAVKNVIAPYSSSGWYYKFKSKLLQSEKVFSMPIVINNDMYVSTFDGSKPGLSGDCGAGVKGESFLTKFCMPYGQCSQTGSANEYKMSLGVGITGGAVGAGESGLTRLIVANVDSTGMTGGSAILGARYNTSMGLVTQRWYEKYK